MRDIDRSFRGHAERRVVEESEEVFGSRVLSAMNLFVGRQCKCGKSQCIRVDLVYDDRVAKIEEEHKMGLEQRGRMNVQLQVQEENARIELDNKRLREIVESVKKRVGV